MSQGAFAPLRSPVFRALWTAAVIANVGTWMQNVAAAWEMTTLSRSSTLVALVQSATSLPVVLVALPAGALADIVDRRRLLVVCQLWIVVSAALLAALSFAGALTPALLLAFTFLLGLGLAMWAPAWMATIPELVPRRELPAAVVLGGVSVNTARAIGPAVGGVLLAVAGAGWVFAANAVLTAFAAAAFWHYGPRGRERSVSAEHVTSAVVAGRRYVRFSPALRRVLWRTALFLFGGSALWAMLPVVARGGLHLGSSGYGLLLTCLGTGAVAVVPAVTRLRAAFAPDVVGALSAAAFGLGTLALALALPLGITCVLLALAGAGWTSTLAVFNTGAQQVLPAWVRARALAYYLLVVQGGLALGSAVWGWLAERTSPETALLAALGVVLVSVLAGTLRPLVRLAAEPGPVELVAGPADRRRRAGARGRPGADLDPLRRPAARARGVRGGRLPRRADAAPRRRRLLAALPRHRAPDPLPRDLRDALVGRAPAPAQPGDTRRRAARARAEPVARVARPGGGAAPRRRPAAVTAHLVGLCA